MINPADFESGQIMLVNKPFGWTSFDVVKKIRCLLKKKEGKTIKVGHAGTLDPYATGLLILCTGKATKKIQFIQDTEKEYTGIIQLGATTPSYDLETMPDKTFPTEHIDSEKVQKVITQFISTQMQVAPIYSAKMVEGKRAYDLARKGESVQLNAHPIVITAFDARLEENYQIIFRVRCSKGTYIRSLAHDLGIALQSGAYLASLTRTAIGEYLLTDALTPKEWETKLLASVTI